MNLTTTLSVQDFTTVEDVKLLIGVEPDDCDRDELIGLLISDVSARFVQFLGLHAVKAARTEVYELRQHKKVLSLDAKPVDTTQPFTVKVASDSDADTFTGMSGLSTLSYSLHAVGGWLRLRIPMPGDPNYVQVTYTGGFGTTPATLAMQVPDLSAACKLQVKYLMNRRDSLGGNISVIGTSAGFGAGGTTYTGEYGLMKEVVAVLEQHRRGTF